MSVNEQMLMTLRAIRSFDPDGRTDPPTEQDREVFKRWVIRDFGEYVWQVYRRDDWDQGPAAWE